MAPAIPPATIVTYAGQSFLDSAGTTADSPIDSIVYDFRHYSKIASTLSCGSNRKKRMNSFCVIF